MLIDREITVALPDAERDCDQQLGNRILTLKRDVTSNFRNILDESLSSLQKLVNANVCDKLVAFQQ